MTNRTKKHSYFIELWYKHIPPFNYHQRTFEAYAKWRWQHRAFIWVMTEAMFFLASFSLFIPASLWSVGCSLQKKGKIISLVVSCHKRVCVCVNREDSIEGLIQQQKCHMIKISSCWTVLKSWFFFLFYGSKSRLSVVTFLCVFCFPPRPSKDGDMVCTFSIRAERRTRTGWSVTFCDAHTQTHRPRTRGPTDGWPVTGCTGI